MLMHTDISWWLLTVLCRLVKGEHTTPAESNNIKNKNKNKSGTNYGMEEKSLEQ